MADTFTHQPLIQLAVQRCYDCGRYWACETNRPGICPVCARERIDRAVAAETKASRAVSALRGALKRKKAKK